MGQLCACAAASCPTGFKTVGSKASCALRPCLGKRSPLVVSICPSAWLRLQDTNNPTRHLPISRPCPSQVGAHGAQMLPRRAAEERQQQMKCHVVDQPGRGDPAPKVGHPTNRQMPIQDPGRAPADWRIDALRHAPASPAATPHSRRLLLQRRQLQWWRLLDCFHCLHHTCPRRGSNFELPAPTDHQGALQGYVGACACHRWCLSLVCPARLKPGCSIAIQAGAFEASCLSSARHCVSTPALFVWRAWNYVLASGVLRFLRG